jgi:hypothetical protein
MGDYLIGLWEAVGRPEWMADTGIPILVTAAGLGVAYVFVKRQLSSDQQLRRADHKREVSTRLGRELIATELDFRRLRDEQQHPRWRTRRWQWQTGPSMSSAWEEAMLLLPVTVPYFSKVSNDVDHLMETCVDQARKIDPDIRHHTMAVASVLSPYMNGLLKAGNDLVAWDGVRELSNVESYVPLKDFNSFDSNDRATMVARYKDGLRHNVSSNYRVPPSGTRFNEFPPID